MAFAIDATIHGWEVRGVTTGTSKKGTMYKSLRVESPDGSHTAEVSCSDSALFPAVDALTKGDVVDLPCVFVSTAPRGDRAARAYVVLSGEPRLSLGA